MQDNLPSCILAYLWQPTQHAPPPLQLMVQHPTVERVKEKIYVRTAPIQLVLKNIKLGKASPPSLRHVLTPKHIAHAERLDVFRQHAASIYDFVRFISFVLFVEKKI